MRAAVEILTIGYGNRAIDGFLDELAAAGVEYLVDVRSAPYSRFKPDFSRRRLAAALEARGIRYVLMGDSLGGRPDDAECYDETGRADYARMRLRPAFREGIARLEAGHSSGHRIALMCAEAAPQDCHRTRLVGEELVALAIPVAHIDQHGQPRSHAVVMQLVTGGQESLFAARRSPHPIRRR